MCLRVRVIVATGAMANGNKLTLLLKGLGRVCRSKRSLSLRRGAATNPSAGGKDNRTVGQPAHFGDRGPMAPLDGRVYARRFERNPDELDNWSNRRAAFLARLAGRQPADTKEPAPSADLGAVRIATKGEARELPNISGQVSTDLPPTPNSPPSGCGVGPWHGRAH